MTEHNFVVTLSPVNYTWDEPKRLSNLKKHGLDFSDAALVYESPYRYDLQVTVKGERRIAAFAYVFDMLAVLVLVATERGEVIRCISYRHAGDKEQELYHEWLANKSDFTE